MGVGCRSMSFFLTGILPYQGDGAGMAPRGHCYFYCKGAKSVQKVYKKRAQKKGGAKGAARGDKPAYGHGSLCGLSLRGRRCTATGASGAVDVDRGHLLP